MIQVLPAQGEWKLLHVERGLNFIIVMPKLHSGRILMTLKYKGQSDRSVWSVFTKVILFIEG